MMQRQISFDPLAPDAVSYLTRATGVDFWPFNFSHDDVWFCCTVRDARDGIMFVLAAEFKTPFDAHISIAIADRRALTRGLLVTIFRALFFKAKRLTSLVDVENRAALNIVQRFGFQYEG